MMNQRAKAPRRGRPRKGDEDDALDRILDAAAASFLTVGYAGTSIDGVTAAAGVSKTTFYARFDSKSALFAEVARRWIETDTRHGTREDGNGSASIGDRLRLIAVGMLDKALKPEVVAFDRIISSEMFRFPELADIHRNLRTMHGAAEIQACLAAGAASGELAIDDVGFATDFFLDTAIRGPLRKAVLTAEDSGLTDQHRRTLDRTISLFLDGARPRDGR